MEAHRAASRSYVAFASAVRRLVLSSTPPLPQPGRAQVSHSPQHRCFASTPRNTSLSPHSLGHSPCGLQGLILHRLSCDLRQTHPIAPTIEDSLDLPPPFSIPPAPRVIFDNDRQLESKAREEPVSSQRQQFQTPPTDPFRAVEVLFSKGKLAQGMLKFSVMLRRLAAGRTYLPVKSDPLRRPILKQDVLSVHNFETLAREIKGFFNGYRELDWSTDDSQQQWRPDGLPSEYDVRQIPPLGIAAFALGSIFDGCVTAGYQPSHEMISITLSCFSRLLPVEAFHEAVKLALNSRCDRSMDLSVLSAIIVGYGRTGRPDIGEQYLTAYARGHHESQEQSSWEGIESFDGDFSGWSHNVAVWNSLVRSYGVAGHLKEAVGWLKRYSHFRKRQDIPQNMRPSPSCGPYLTLMTSIVEQQSQREHPGAFESAPSPDVVREIMEVLSLMVQDGVKATRPMLNFLSNFEKRRGHHESSELLLGVPRPALPREENQQTKIAGNDVAERYWSALHSERRNWNSYTYRQLFDNKAHEPISQSSSHQSHTSLPSLRSLLVSLLKVHHRQTQGNLRKVSTVVHESTLLSALKATVAHRDYPAAIIVLQTFMACCIPLDLPQVFDIISHGIQKFSSLPISKTATALHQDTVQIPKIGYFQAVLETAMLHELEVAENFEMEDSLVWVKAVLHAQGEEWKKMSDKDKVFAALNDARMEILPPRNAARRSPSPREAV